jgi:hypothetical protein
MHVEDASELLQRYRYAIADTCAAKGIFAANITGPDTEYQATRRQLELCLKVEGLTHTACLDAMLDCGCRDREFGRAESVCMAQKERTLDYEEGRCQSSE